MDSLGFKFRVWVLQGLLSRNMGYFSGKFSACTEHGSCTHSEAVKPQKQFNSSSLSFSDTIDLGVSEIRGTLFWSPY